MAINATPEAAWKVIGAVTGVDQWLAPVITACRVEGNKRFCTTETGEFSEDILKVDHRQCELHYAIPQQHFLPVKNIVGVMKVRARDDNQALIEWSWTFEVEPHREAEAKEMLAATGALGIQGIENLVLSKIS